MLVGYVVSCMDTYNYQGGFVSCFLSSAIYVNLMEDKYAADRCWDGYSWGNKYDSESLTGCRYLVITLVLLIRNTGVLRGEVG